MFLLINSRIHFQLKCFLAIYKWHIAELHRISRARYHRSIRQIQRNKKISQSEKTALALMSNNFRALWSEVRKLKGRNSKISTNVDGSCDSKVITRLFSEV